MNSLFEKSIPHLIAGFVFLAVSVVYFLPQLQGKVIQQSDIVNFKGMSQEAKAFQEKTGEAALWTNSMFGGMPTYQISSPQRNNLMKYVDKALNLFFARPIGYFFYGMLLFYILMVALGVSSWLSIIGAIAFGLATNNLILFETGHTSKVRTIFYLAPILAGLLLTFRKKYLVGGVLFAAGLALNLYVNHPQMTYYFFMMLLIYGVMELVKNIRANELPHFLKATGILLLGVVLALGASASKMLTTYEYAADTMRGDPILKAATTTAKSSSETSGLEYGYWGNWSNAKMDLVAGVIPGVLGGGSGEKLAKDAKVGRFFRGKGPMYWGQLPGTSGPVYYGAIIFFLFLLGAVLVKGELKWWLVAAVVLTMIMSLGKHFGINKLLFEYFPMYNKFRAPSSILSVTTFLVPVLAILGLSAVVNGKAEQKEKLKALYIAGGVSGVICLFFALIGPSFFDFTSPGDVRYQEQTQVIDALISDRQSMMTGDAWRSFALIALATGVLWAFIQQKIKWIPLVAVLGVLITGDLWTVGKRYLGADSFVPQSTYNISFRPRPVDQQILKDKDLSYRVYDATVNTFNNAIVSYHHKTIGGYHAAKLQRYEDIAERHIRKNNQAVINMLNTKYFILGQPGKEQAQQNPGALGNAWFVSSVREVADANAEIDALTGLNPAEEAIIHKEFSSYVSGLNLQKNGTIKLTAYTPNQLTYATNTTSEQLALFSEVWYGPDKGWNAYVDGKLVDHIRANYILRGLKVPAGQHEVVFKFEPSIFKTGEMISLISSLLILLGLLGFIGISMSNKMNEPIEAPVREVPVAKKPKVKPTVSKTKSKSKKSNKKKK